MSAHSNLSVEPQAFPAARVIPDDLLLELASRPEEGDDQIQSASATIEQPSVPQTKFPEKRDSVRESSPSMGSDFISDYADCADIVELPREAHEWIACQLIAAILNGKV